jgi:hypothetical protein
MSDEIRLFFARFSIHLYDDEAGRTQIGHGLRRQGELGLQLP